jgi:hypothetical protein
MFTWAVADSVCDRSLGSRHLLGLTLLLLLKDGPGMRSIWRLIALSVFCGGKRCGGT